MSSAGEDQKLKSLKNELKGNTTTFRIHISSEDGLKLAISVKIVFLFLLILYLI
jgi:hypothetical protein